MACAYWLTDSRNSLLAGWLFGSLGSRGTSQNVCVLLMLSYIPHVVAPKRIAGVSVEDGSTSNNCVICMAAYLSLCRVRLEHLHSDIALNIHPFLLLTFSLFLFCQPHIGLLMIRTGWRPCMHVDRQSWSKISRNSSNTVFISSSAQRAYFPLPLLFVLYIQYFNSWFRSVNKLMENIVFCLCAFQALREGETKVG